MADVTIARYICKSCINESKTEADAIVADDRKHLHGCPLEGGTCGLRGCNETGSCQA